MITGNFTVNPSLSSPLAEVNIRYDILKCWMQIDFIIGFIIGAGDESRSRSWSRVFTSACIFLEGPAAKETMQPKPEHWASFCLPVYPLCPKLWTQVLESHLRSLPPGQPAPPAWLWPWSWLATLARDIPGHPNLPPAFLHIPAHTLLLAQGN